MLRLIRQAGHYKQNLPPSITIMSTSRNERLILLVNQRKGSHDGSKSELLCNETLTRFEFLTPTKRHRQEPKTDQNTSTFYCHHTLSMMFTAGWVDGVLIPHKLPKASAQPAWSRISRAMPLPHHTADWGGGGRQEWGPVFWDSSSCLEGASQFKRCLLLSLIENC